MNKFVEDEPINRNSSGIEVIYAYKSYFVKLSQYDSCHPNPDYRRS
jgi:hypothetical protein